MFNPCSTQRKLLTRQGPKFSQQSSGLNRGETPPSYNIYIHDSTQKIGREHNPILGGEVPCNLFQRIVNKNLIILRRPTLFCLLIIQKLSIVLMCNALSWPKKKRKRKSRWCSVLSILFLSVLFSYFTICGYCKDQFMKVEKWKNVSWVVVDYSAVKN